MSHSYTKELELLILETLLPVYVRTLKAEGVANPYYGINSDLIKQLKAKQQVPALFKPKQI